MTKDAFAQILDAYTEDNEVLVIDTCAEHQVDLLERLYWWKAQDAVLVEGTDWWKALA